MSEEQDLQIESIEEVTFTMEASEEANVVIPGRGLKEPPRDERVNQITSVKVRTTDGQLKLIQLGETIQDIE